MARWDRAAAAVVIGLALGLPGGAQADQHESATSETAAEAPMAPAEDTGGAMSSGAEPATSGGEATDGAAADAEQERYPDLDVPGKPWSYDTGYFFALTRGLDEEPLSDWGRRASMAGTVPLDVVCLPGAALAGLFGS